VRGPDPSRRRFVTALAALPLLPLHALAACERTTLAAAWDDASGRHWIGLMDVDPSGAHMREAIEVPTRAHGIACCGDGSVLAVARRPGEWMLRWRPATPPRWQWVEEDRRFCGHMLPAPGQDALFTTELDLDSGQGRLVRRNPGTLAVESVWDTHGRDPHDLEWLGDGTLLVANGGVETRPESGRVKHDLAHMDSSLARIDARTGALLGQWRLDDRRLSLRHLARHKSGTVGIALQAEHDEASSRAAAPLFAVLDLGTGTLAPAPAMRSDSGYAGDVAAVREGWLLTCPKDDYVVLVPLSGHSPVRHPIAEGCAIAIEGTGRHAWVLGSARLLTIDWPEVEGRSGPLSNLDNHAILLPSRSCLGSG
jgi:hypothetical protein